MKLPTLIRRRPGGLAECPYFHLSMLDFGRFSFRLHRWTGDDDHRAMHDHRQWFWTLVLRGGYTDVSYDPATGRTTRDRLRRFSLRFRPATFIHQVLDIEPGTVTLLLAGRPARRWGSGSAGS